MCHRFHKMPFALATLNDPLALPGSANSKPGSRRSFGDKQEGDKQEADLIKLPEQITADI